MAEGEVITNPMGRTLIHDLFALSCNSTLFEEIRTGCVPAEVPGGTPAAEVRNAIASVLRIQSFTLLNRLTGDGHIGAKVALLGEVILALYALNEGKHSGAGVDALFNSARGKSSDLAKAFELAPPQDSADRRRATPRG